MGMSIARLRLFGSRPLASFEAPNAESTPCSLVGYEE